MMPDELSAIELNEVERRVVAADLARVHHDAVAKVRARNPQRQIIVLVPPIHCVESARTELRDYSDLIRTSERERILATFSSSERELWCELFGGPFPVKKEQNPVWHVPPEIEGTEAGDKRNLEQAMSAA